MNEVQAFLARHVGRCDTCGHALRRIAHMHPSNDYPSGLSLMDTHGQVTEVGDGEPTGVGCSECEKGLAHRVNRHHEPVGGYLCREVTP